MIIVKPDMGVVKTSGALGAGIFPLSASIEYNSFDLRIFPKESFEIIHLFVSNIPVCACPSIKALTPAPEDVLDLPGYNYYNSKKLEKPLPSAFQSVGYELDEDISSQTFFV